MKPYKRIYGFIILFISLSLLLFIFQNQKVTAQGDFNQCDVTVSPATATVNVGASAALTAGVTFLRSSVQQVSFSSNSPSSVSVNPATDSSSPYSTSATGVSGPSISTITARATLIDGTTCSDVATVTVNSGPTPTRTRTPTPTMTNTPTPTITKNIVHQQTVKGGSVSSKNVSTSTTISSATNNLYLASVSTKPKVSVSSISGLGIDWVKIESQCSARSQTNVEVWKGVGNPTTSGKVTATLASTPKAAVISVSRYSGVTMSSPIGSVVSANTLGINGSCTGGVDKSSYSVNLPISSSGSFAYGVVSIRHRSHTPGSGYTERAEIHAGSSGDTAGEAVEDNKISSASTVAVKGTLSSSSDWAVIGVELK